MNRKYKIFFRILLSLVSILLVLIISLNSTNPQENSTEHVCNHKHERAVCLDEKFLFWIENTAPMPSNSSSQPLTAAERATEIKKRIKEIADDESFSLSDLKIEAFSSEELITIRSPKTVIVTITNGDAVASSIPKKDKDKLASQYLERIKNAIRDYRKEKRRETRLGWFEDHPKTILEVISFPFGIVILLLSIFFVRQAIKKPGKFVDATEKFIVDAIGKGIEGILAIIIILSFVYIFLNFFLNFFLSTIKSFLTEELFWEDPKSFFDRIQGLIDQFGLVFILGVIFLAFKWLSSKEKRIIVSEFENYLNEDSGLGKFLAGELVSQISQIGRIHNAQSRDTKDKDDSSKGTINTNLSLVIKDDVSKSLSDIGTIEFSKARVPIGKVLTVLKVIWPFGGTEKVISGSIHKVGDQTHLIANVRGLKEFKILEAEAGNFDVNIVPMVEDLAYRISLLLSSDIKTESWIAFKNYTEALLNYQKYHMSRNLNLLDKAKKSCETARKEDYNYERVSALLHKIYNDLGNVNFSKENNCEAYEYYNRAIEIDKCHPIPYYNLGHLFLYTDPSDYAPKKKSGKYKEAENYYKISESLLEKDKGFIEKDKGFIHDGLSMAYLFQSDNKDLVPGEIKKLLENAISEVEKSISIKEDSYINQWNLGMIRFRQNRLHDSQKAWMKACKLLEETNKGDKEKILYPIFKYSEEAIKDNANSHKLDKFIEEIESEKYEVYCCSAKTMLNAILEDLFLIARTKTGNVKVTKRFNKLTEVIKEIKNNKLSQETRQDA